MRRYLPAVAAALLWPCALHAEELVQFDSIASWQYQTTFARSRGDTPELRAATPIQGYLTKPAGSGPFAAVVLLHSCFGLPANHTAIAKTFVDWGYVTLFVDDFTTRGIRHSCKNSSFGETVQDALGALVYAGKLPYVDVRRLAVVGYSQGGSTALAIAMNRLPPLAGDVRPPLPKAVVSFYPWCADTRGRVAVPTLLLIGERDDWTPAAFCEDLWRKRSNEGAEFRLITYPGAFHAFENPDLAGGRNVFGHWLQYDPESGARAMEEVRAFLAKQLQN